MVAAVLAALIALQTAPFADDIAKFRELDRKKMPEPGQIVFAGSSSFTRWTDVASYFPARSIINRGFGGSSLLDVIRYANDVILKYRPKTVVIYCGENDLAGDAKLSAYAVEQRFRQLFGMIRKDLPNARIVYVSMKPSPSRWSLRAKFRAGNHFIESYLAKQPNTAFIDVWPSMLGSDGRPRRELFVDDELHMNEEGYRLWAPLIEKALEVR